MCATNYDTVCDQLKRDLDKCNNPIRRIRVNSHLYKYLCQAVDETAWNAKTGSERFHDMDIIDDPRVETYEIEY